MKLARITPADGVRVRDPLTAQPIPKEGKVVEYERSRVYWTRKQLDGDVEIEEIPDPVSAEQTEAETVSASDPDYSGGE